MGRHHLVGVLVGCCDVTVGATEATLIRKSAASKFT